MPPVSPTSHSVKNSEQSLYQTEWISPMSPFNCLFSLQESYIYLFSPHSTDCLPFSGTDCLASGKPSCCWGTIHHPGGQDPNCFRLAVRTVSGRKALNHSISPFLSPGQSSSFRLLAPRLLTSACRNLLWFIMLLTFSTAFYCVSSLLVFQLVLVEQKALVSLQIFNCLSTLYTGYILPAKIKQNPS